MKLRPLPTLKIQQQPSRVSRWLKLEAARMGLYGGAALLAGWLIAEPMLDAALASVQREAEVQALQQFEEGWKTRLSQNQPLLRSACTTWWFGMNGRDRRLK